MAFAKSGLFKVGGADPGLWIYKSADAIATVIGADYFGGSRDEIKGGDVIIAIDTNLNSVDVLAVTSVSGAASVTVANGT